MRRLFVFVLSALAANAAATPPSWLTESATQLRVGLDTNPLAVGAASAGALGKRDTATFAAGLSIAVTTPPGAAGANTKLTYATELVRYDGWSSENYATHRLALLSRTALGEWRLAADASSLFVDGSRETLPSLGACNGNGTALWRERREQWQHRAKIVAQRDAGVVRIRFLATLLDYDYLTHTTAGRVPFVDRKDMLGGVDAGWQESGTSFVFAGFRAGAQQQDFVPLPGGAIDYSSRYSRLIAGWEAKPNADSTVALSAGPDFRHYDGAVDPKVFHHRNRTLFWFDASFSTKLSPRLTFAGKTTRWSWLSSTGKSAYTDFSSELSLSWAFTSAFSLRGSVKAHQCSYFPVVRNDWELCNSLGLVYRVSPRLQLSADVLDHRGWNELPRVSDRNFTRDVCSVGASWLL